MRFLDGLRRHFDILKVEELALEGDGLAGKGTADDFEGLVGARAALLGRHAETLKLFALEADPNAKLEATAGDHINGRNVLGQADRIVQRHQQHPGCDADPVGTGGDRRGGGQDRGKIAVFDEVVLGQPDIIETVVFAPRDLVEDFAVQAVGGLTPLCWVAEVIPKAEPYLSSFLAHLGLLMNWGMPKTLDQICAAPPSTNSSMPVM